MGDPRFFDAVQRISELFAAQQNDTQIPGLWPIIVNPREKKLTAGNQFCFGGMADSLYEYTMKMYILLGGLKPEYRQMYEGAIDAAKKYLFFRPMNPENRDILLSTTVTGDSNGVIQDHSGQHLACFAGGMIAQGAKILGQDEDLDLARKLTDGCHWAYTAMHSGIMPETLHAVPCPDPKNCSWNSSIWHSAIRSLNNIPPNMEIQDLITSQNLPPGITSIPDPRYLLRPEALESIFYMYRITGDSSWQDKAWGMFQSIERATRSEYGYSAVEDVAAEELVRTNSMESFWTAETLKYGYLIFCDVGVVSLDEWVFNTEAHPLRRVVPEGKEVGG